MSILSINAIDKNGLVTVLDIKPSEAAPWILRVSGIGFDDKEFGGSDLFTALIKLRHELELQGCRLLCAGARRDVYPSGMARSMGSARKAYVTKWGEPATETLDIFDYADESQVGTLDEQRLHREQWAASLRERLGA